MTEACTFVLFGATGDLAKKKLVPALQDLHGNGGLHEDTRIIAIGRRDYDDDKIREELSAEGGFGERITYHRLEFSDDDAYARLKERLDGLPESIRNKRLFYLATPQTAFPEIVERLHDHGIAKRDPDEWHRVVFEKPFGSDLDSARKLNAVITKLFREEQIYRIDHYVGKTVVREILVLRFSNPVFERIWDANHISRVQIEVHEDMGVGSRAGYYDESGALRDMVQNHLLQLLSLVAMEEPEELSAKEIRDEKARVLESVVIDRPEDVSEHLVCGQYDGYRDEEGVADGSETETYAAVRLELDNERWKGTPFYLVTGKALDDRYAEIALEFQSDACSLFREDNESCGRNYLIIRIQPDEGVCFIFNLADDERKSISPQVMEYSHEATKMNTPEAYELLLREAITGDQTLFTRWDFVERSWRIVDNLRQHRGPIETYEKGSEGPARALEMLERKHKRIRD